VNLCIHNAGSFGTNWVLDAYYFYYPAALLVDFDRDGFLPKSPDDPGFAGEFSIGPLVEGQSRPSVLPSVAWLILVSVTLFLY
jgi:hypothetical protein